MAKERIAPITVLQMTNYSSLLLADIDDDPDDPDGTWGTWRGLGNTVAQVRFGDPSLPLTPGADLQEFRCLIRKNSEAGTPNVADWQMSLHQAGPLLAVIATGSFPSDDWEEVVVSGRWDASILGTGTVQCQLRQLAGGGGNDRSGVELGAVVWVAEMTPPHSLAPPDRTVTAPAAGNVVEAAAQDNVIVAGPGPTTVVAGQ